MITSVRTLPSLKRADVERDVQVVVDRLDDPEFAGERAAYPGLQGAVGGGVRKLGGGINGELGDSAVGVLEVQVDIDIVAMGQDVGRLDGLAFGGMRHRLQHQVDGRPGGQRWLGDGQEGMTDRAVLVGRFHIELDRHLVPIDHGHQIFAGAEIALFEDVAKGDLAGGLRFSGHVLQLEADDLAGLGGFGQIRRLEHRP